MAEDHYAAWAWLILTVIIVVFVAAFDLWAHYTGHHTMTGQFRLWLADHIIGSFIFGGLMGMFAGLFWHFVVQKGGR